MSRKMRWVVLWLGLALVSCGGEDQQVDAIEESFPNVKYLRVYGAFAQVDIEGIDGTETQVSGSIIAGTSPGSYQITAHPDANGTLKIRITEPVAKVGSATGKLSFKVPKSTEIKVVNETGDVYVHGMEGEKVRVKTSSGDVVAENINTYLRVKSLEGDILVSDHVGDVKTKSTSGDHVLSNVQGNVLSISTSGDVNCTGVKGSLHAQTTSGDISGVQVELMHDSDFTSNSGSVKMRLANPAVEDIKFDLYAKTGQITVGDSLGRERYQTGTGSLMVMGKTQSGNQSFK